MCPIDWPGSRRPTISSACWEKRGCRPVVARLPTLLLLVLPSALAGQSTSDRAAFDHLRDSLAVVYDTAALRTLQRSFHDRRDPAGRVELALVALRRADLQ